MTKDKTPPMFVENYDGNDYTVEELQEGIQWLVDELNTRDESYTFVTTDDWT